MNADRLMAHFVKISDAPDAVDRLRRFILDLAVRGKLVPQDEREGTAEELLNDIRHSKTTTASKANRRAESQLDAAVTELPYCLPSSWRWTPFSSLITHSDSGWSPKTEGFPRLGNEWGVLKVSAVSWDVFRPEENKQLLPGVTPPDAAVVHKGDFLISRANTSHLIARCVIVKDAPRNLIMSDKIVRLHLVEQCDPFFLKIVNNDSGHARDYYAAKATGTSLSMKNVSRDVIYGLAIPLPPLAEQHRIVEKVDELMKLCDRLEASQAEREGRRDRLLLASLNRLSQPTDPDEFNKDARFQLSNLNRLSTKREHITELRKAILNLAVRGKLVPQDDREEPFNDHVSDGGDLERRLDMELPAEWRWVQLRDVAESRLGKMLDKAKNRGKPYRYLRNTNVHWFEIRLEEIKTMPLAAEEATAFLLAPGDVVICEGGHGIARTAVWRGDGEEMAFQKALHRVRPGKRLSGDFLSYCIRVYFDEGVLQRLYTGVGIPHFTGVALSKLVFPLPPLAEQKRIVAKVDELIAICDQLEKQLDTQQNESRRLLEALLHEALEGVG